MKTYLFVCFIILTVCQNVVASEKRLPEQSAIDDVIGGLKIFEAIHNGQSPTNWTQVSEVLNLKEIDQYLAQHLYDPIEQNYVFIQQKIAVPTYEKGDVVLMRIAPITIQVGDTNQEEGRYFISRYKGGLKFNWLSENKVQKMLADAGVVELPKPAELVRSPNAAEIHKVANQTSETKPVHTSSVSPAQLLATHVAEAASSAIPDQTTNPPVAPHTGPSFFAKLLVITLFSVFVLALALLLHRRKRNP